MSYTVTLIPATASAPKWPQAMRRVVDATGVHDRVGRAGGRRRP